MFLNGKRGLFYFYGSNLFSRFVVASLILMRIIEQGALSDRTRRLSIIILGESQRVPRPHSFGYEKRQLTEMNSNHCI